MRSVTDKNEIIRNIEALVRERLKDAEGGHDWQHIQRVRNLALHIAECEGADLFIVGLAALLHDIADSKFHSGDEEIGVITAEKIMDGFLIPPGIKEEVLKIIKNISFRSEIGGKVYDSPELCAVQDADRLDAIGAIGIARAFNYGGSKGREIYNPEIPPKELNSTDDYKSRISPTINHFYEKLLLLKDMMKTGEGKRLATERHEFLELYLKQFFKEANIEIKN